MEVKYEDYSYSDSKQRFVPYQPEERTPYYGPEDERFQFQRNPEYYLVKHSRPIKTKKKSGKSSKSKTKIIKETETSDITQEGKSNEKLYIGLLIGSTGLFLITLFYFLFVTNKRKK